METVQERAGHAKNNGENADSVQSSVPFTRENAGADTESVPEIRDPPAGNT